MIFAVIAIGANLSWSAEFSGGIAQGQASAALDDNQSAQSSQAGGRVYDTGETVQAAPALNYTGPLGSDALQSKTWPPPPPIPLSSPDTQDVPTPISSAGTSYPWELDLHMAMLLISAAALLLLAAKLVVGPNLVAGSALAALGASIIFLGAQISNVYGQVSQGNLLIAVGAVLVVAGVSMAAASSGGAQTGGSQASDSSAASGGNPSPNASSPMGGTAVAMIAPVLVPLLQDNSGASSPPSTDEVA